MNPSSVDSDFPEIHSSFRFQPHEPILTYSAPSPSIASKPIASNPRIANTMIDFSTRTTDIPLIWITSTIPPASRSQGPTYTTPVPLQSVHAASNASNPPSETSTPSVQNGEYALSKGSKIGIIVGIAVVVILCSVAIALCAVDMRRRMKRKQEEKQSRDAELYMLENELRNGRVRSGDKRNSKAGGLWDGLRIGRLSDEMRKEEANAQAEKDRKGSKALWERSGETRSQEAAYVRKDSTLGTERYGSEHEWLPVYMPRERASIVSSVGSMGFPLPPRPVIAKSFLECDGKR